MRKLSNRGYHPVCTHKPARYTRPGSGLPTAPLFGLRSGVFAVLMVCCAAVGAETGTVLWYLEQEAGIDPYRVRYIVTGGFMRSDEGDDNGGFVLLDRNERQIYNVVPGNRTILQIDGKGTLPDLPQHLSVEIRQSSDPEAPSVAGKTPLTLELLANRELCYSAVIVPGFLEQVRSAMQEFAQSLAVQQLRTLSATPEEYQTPCFLSRYIYATDFHVRQGIPIMDWHSGGQRRQLLDYQTGVELDSRLFELPEDYAVLQASGR